MIKHTCLAIGSRWVKRLCQIEGSKLWWRLCADPSIQSGVVWMKGRRVGRETLQMHTYTKSHLPLNEPSNVKEGKLQSWRESGPITKGWGWGGGGVCVCVGVGFIMRYSEQKTRQYATYIIRPGKWSNYEGMGVGGGGCVCVLGWGWVLRWCGHWICMKMNQDRKKVTAFSCPVNPFGQSRVKHISNI